MAVLCLCRCAVLGMLAALLLAPRTAAAAPLYCVAFGIGNIDCTPQSASPLSSLDVPTVGLPTGSSGTGSAVAGTTAPASLGVQAVVAGSGFGAFTTARAELSGYEVVLSGPIGGTATTSLNLSATGSIFIGPGGNSNQGTLTVTTTLAGSQGTATGQGSFITGLDGVGGGPPTYYSAATGILTGLFSLQGNFATPTLSVVSGETVLLSLSLDAQARCLETFGGSCGTTTNYLNTLGLRTTGPVFNLPAGWTANSPDGSIVNNVFVEVPESSTCALVALSIIGIFAARRLAF